jgi:hypothetical protein
VSRCLSALGSGVLCGLFVVTTTPVVRADEAEPFTAQKRSAPRFSVNHRPAEGLSLELGRELHWARMTLVEDLPFLADGQTLAPILPLAPGALDPHALLASPRALGTVASAVGQLATGLPVFELWHEGRLVRRHHFRPHVGLTSVRLTWRIDF